MTSWIFLKITFGFNLARIKSDFYFNPTIRMENPRPRISITMLDQRMQFLIGVQKSGEKEFSREDRFWFGNFFIRN